MFWHCSSSQGSKALRAHGCRNPHKGICSIPMGCRSTAPLAQVGSTQALFTKEQKSHSRVVQVTFNRAWVLQCWDRGGTTHLALLSTLTSGGGRQHSCHLCISLHTSKILKLLLLVMVSNSSLLCCRLLSSCPLAPSKGQHSTACMAQSATRPKCTSLLLPIACKGSMLLGQTHLTAYWMNIHILLN